nr:hypothetical protein Iba_chr14eCG9010 [Ipomoea batatas]
MFLVNKFRTALFKRGGSKPRKSNPTQPSPIAQYLHWSRIFDKDPPSLILGSMTLRVLRWEEI